MSMAQFLALLLCAFCLAALLLGLIRPAWVLPSRRATRVQVLVLYSVASVIGPLLAGEFAHRAAHAQSPDPNLDPGSFPTADNLREQEPEPETLRALASRVLLDLGLGPGHRLRIGRLTLAYEDPVTEEQALALGEFLSRAEVGSDRGATYGLGSRYGRVQVQLRKNGPAGPEAAALAGLGGGPGPGPDDTYQIHIATPFSSRQQLAPETKAAYQLVALLASGLAFDGAPVQVHVCTPLLRPLLILRSQLRSAAALTP